MDSLNLELDRVTQFVKAKPDITKQLLKRPPIKRYADCSILCHLFCPFAYKIIHTYTIIFFLFSQDILIYTSF